MIVLSALFMIVVLFSANSEYSWLRFQSQVVGHTTFVVCFQRASGAPSGHRKYWEILRKLFWKRQQEGVRHRSLLPGIPYTSGFSGCFFNMGAFQKGSKPS